MVEVDHNLNAKRLALLSFVPKHDAVILTKRIDRVYSPAIP